MGRILSLGLGAIAALLLLGVLLWYLAYGLGASAPRQVTVDGLESPVEVGWQENGLTRITAEEEGDQYRGLGFAHGSRRTWSALLWRQAAVGRLSHWFGDELLAVDSLTRQLGLAELAQQSYRQLSDEDQERLQAYAAGVNAALRHAPAETEPNLMLLNLQPDPWEPWHALAVERLYAWLSTPTPPRDSLQQASPQAHSFFEADSTLRSWMHVHSLQHSSAWVASDSAGTHLFRRYVYGSTALPLLHEVALQRPDSTYLLGVSLPGTPFFPAGQTQDRAWVLLPNSDAQLIRSTWPDTSRNPTYDRLEGADGTEHLLRIWRRSGLLFFDQPQRNTALQVDDTTSAPGDTLAPAGPQDWALQWSGLEPNTDLSAWRALAAGTTPSFALQNGGGLTLQPGGQWALIGTPEHTVSVRNGLLAGNDPWVETVGGYLDTLSQETGTDILAWRDNCFSAWAAEQAPQLIASVDSVQNDPSPRMGDALTYLRNWNHVYARSSIAASIFEQWASLYENRTGNRPGSAEADTLFSEAVPPPASATPDTSDTTAVAPPDTLQPSYREHMRRYRLLEQAVAQLSERFGEDMREWRWERVNQARYFFPAWSAAGSDDSAPFMGRTRYAPIELPGQGHPSAPCWGPSSLLQDRAAHATWQGWTSTNDWNDLTVQRRLFELSSFLDRYRVPDRVPEPVSLEVFQTPDRVTTLVPPS